MGPHPHPQRSSLFPRSIASSPEGHRSLRPSGPSAPVSTRRGSLALRASITGTCSPAPRKHLFDFDSHPPRMTLLLIVNSCTSIFPTVGNHLTWGQQALSHGTSSELFHVSGPLFPDLALCTRWPEVLFGNVRCPAWKRGQSVLSVDPSQWVDEKHRTVSEFARTKLRLLGLAVSVEKHLETPSCCS